jgi:hypothetical protein
MNRPHPVSPQKARRIREASNIIQKWVHAPITKADLDEYFGRAKVISGHEQVTRAAVWDFLESTKLSSGDLARYLGRNERAMRRLCSSNGPRDEFVDVPIQQLEQDIQLGRLEDKVEFIPNSCPVWPDSTSPEPPEYFREEDGRYR